MYCGIEVVSLRFTPIWQDHHLNGSRLGQGLGRVSRSQSTGRISDRDPSPGHSETRTPDTCSVISHHNLGNQIPDVPL